MLLSNKWLLLSPSISFTREESVKCDNFINQYRHQNYTGWQKPIHPYHLQSKPLFPPDTNAHYMTERAVFSFTYVCLAFKYDRYGIHEILVDAYNDGSNVWTPIMYALPYTGIILQTVRPGKWRNPRLWPSDLWDIRYNAITIKIPTRNYRSKQAIAAIWQGFITLNAITPWKTLSL